MKKNLLILGLVVLVCFTSCKQNTKDNYLKEESRTIFSEDTEEENINNNEKVKKAENVGEYLGVHKEKDVYLSKDGNSLVSINGLPIDFFYDRFNEHVTPSPFINNSTALSLNVGDSIGQIKEKLNYSVAVIDENILNSGFSFYAYYSENDDAKIGILTNERQISIYDVDNPNEKEMADSDYKDKRRIAINSGKTNFEYAYVIYYSNLSKTNTNLTKKKIKSLKKGMTMDEVINILEQEPTLSYMTYNDESSIKLDPIYSWTQDAEYMNENNTVYVTFDGDYISKSIAKPNIKKSIFSSTDDDIVDNIPDDSFDEEEVEKWVKIVLNYREKTSDWSFLKEQPYTITTEISPDDGLIYSYVRQDSVDGLNATLVATFRVDKHGQLQEYSVSDDHYTTIATEYGDHGIIPKLY